MKTINNCLDKMVLSCNKGINKNIENFNLPNCFIKCLNFDSHGFSYIKCLNGFKEYILKTQA